MRASIKEGLRELRQPHLPELGTRAASAPANGSGEGSTTLVRLCPSLKLWREEMVAGLKYIFTDSTKAEEQAANCGFVRCAVQYLPEVSVPAPAPVTAPAQGLLRIPQKVSFPAGLYEQEGQGFISRVEDGWKEDDDDETFNALWIWTRGDRNKAWKGLEHVKANSTKISGAMAVYWALVHFDQLEGVTRRT